VVFAYGHSVTKRVKDKVRRILLIRLVASVIEKTRSGKKRMFKHNVILDIDVALDLLANRQPASQAVEAALEKALHVGCQVWLVAACLPTLLERLEQAFKGGTDDTGKEAIHSKTRAQARDTLRNFLNKVRVLSSYGFDAEAAFESEQPVSALILCAADAFADDVDVLSRDPALLCADRRVVDPQTYADRDHSTSQPEEPISFVDLARQQQRILPELEKGVVKVLRNGQYIMGPEIQELEKKLAEYVGVEHVICCSSGTDALLMALMAYGVGPGDAIFTSTFTFISTAEVISLLGATPVFVDIDPRTFNIDSDCLDIAISACKERNPEIYPLPALPKGRTANLEPKGIIAVDLFGLPADYDRINALATKHDLFVVEDAAQSFGAEYRGKRACSLTDIGCTSFYPSKPLGGYGDGGAVFTENHEIAEKIASIRIHGMGQDQYDNVRIGVNARMDTLQAALLLPKLELFPSELDWRHHVANLYTELLTSHESLQIPTVPEGYRSAWALYSILSNRRDELRDTVTSKGVPTAIYYPKPLHLQTAFSHLGYKSGDFPVAESTAKQILSLPIHPYLHERDITRIAKQVMETFEWIEQDPPTRQGI
jgi:UDP-2-acetamido-2-deoxy-ribo-hexuluronate aminotransferase